MCFNAPSLHVTGCSKATFFQQALFHTNWQYNLHPLSHPLLLYNNNNNKKKCSNIYLSLQSKLGSWVEIAVHTGFIINPVQCLIFGLVLFTIIASNSYQKLL